MRGSLSWWLRLGVTSIFYSATRSGGMCAKLLCYAQDVLSRDTSKISLQIVMLRYFVFMGNQ